jgi:DNA-binding transcriptional MerR regulator
MDGYTVGQVAELANISVRTLHHYDEIGLLHPSARSAAGYRLYSADDLGRLREILFWRELDFSLEEIAAILADPGRGTDQRLREQHRLLRGRIDRDLDLLTALEKEMELRQMGMSLTPDEQFEVFGTDKVGGDWAEEAKERWGDTDAFQESQRRTTHYTKEDWLTIKEQSDAGLREFAAALADGIAADSARAMDLAEAHRQFISRWFYECGYDVHRGLAEMYVADERFTRYYDDAEPGLALFVRDIVLASINR